MAPFMYRPPDPATEAAGYVELDMRQSSVKQHGRLFGLSIPNHSALMLHGVDGKAVLVKLFYNDGETELNRYYDTVMVTKTLSDGSEARYLPVSPGHHELGYYPGEYTSIPDPEFYRNSKSIMRIDPPKFLILTATIRAGHYYALQINSGDGVGVTQLLLKDQSTGEIVAASNY